MKSIFANRNYKVRTLQILNHLMLIPAVLYGNLGWWLAAIFMYFVFFCLGIDIGVHRLFSHRAFKTSRFSEWFLGTCFTLSSVGSSIAWAGMHRQHHKYSDKEQDPHSPLSGQSKILYALKTYLGVWKFYVARPGFTSDLRHDPLHRFFHRYYLLVILLYVAVLSLIHPLAPIFLYCIPAVFCFHGASLIVTAGHMFGSRDLKTSDQSRNSLLLHIFTWGEGLHNLHHAYPKKHRYTDGPARHWYFFDLPGFLIDTIFATNEQTARERSSKATLHS